MVVDLVELRRQQALGPRGPFIYFNLVVVVVLPSLAYLTASATLFVYNWTAKTYYRSSNRDIGCLLLDKRVQHRYRRTQLLGAGGC